MLQRPVASIHSHRNIGLDIAHVLTYSIQCFFQSYEDTFVAIVQIYVFYFERNLLKEYLY